MLEFTKRWQRPPLAAAAMGLILLGALMPNSYKVALRLNHSSHPVVHAIAHATAFGALAHVLALHRRLESRHLLAVLSSTIFGAGTEILETLVYRQPLEVLDIMVNAMGAILGGLLILLKPTLIISKPPNKLSS